MCGVAAAGHLVRLTTGVAGQRAHGEDNCVCVYRRPSQAPGGSWIQITEATVAASVLGDNGTPAAAVCVVCVLGLLQVCAAEDAGAAVVTCV